MRFFFFFLSLELDIYTNLLVLSLCVCVYFCAFGCYAVVREGTGRGRGRYIQVNCETLSGRKDTLIRVPGVDRLKSALYCSSLRVMVMAMLSIGLEMSMAVRASL